MSHLFSYSLPPSKFCGLFLRNLIFMHTSLVTGGAGFIGSHITRELLNQGHKVVVLDDLSGGFQENISDELTFIKGSITDHLQLEKIFEDFKIDYVYHLAAYAAEGLSHFIRRFNYTNNLLGSVNLINESIKHNVKCFVFTSSIAVYGALTPPMKEDMYPEPEDPYGVAKLAVEMDLRTAKEMFDLNYIIFRPHNVYGEFQNIGDKYRNVIGIFMNQLMKGDPLTIFGDGNQTRAFSYIGDLAPTIANSIHLNDAYNEIFNIGADKEYTVNELAHSVIESMDINGTIKYLDARNEVVHAYADHSKANRFFDISYTPVDVGLKKMANWAKSRGIQSSDQFDNIEITKNLPASWQT